MTTFCTNLRSSEMTEYSGYDFLAFGRLGEAYFGLRADGIYQLGGDTDAGTRIEAAAQLHPNPLETAQRGAEWHAKRATVAYVDAGGAPVAVTVVADETAVGTFYGAGRVKLARGARGQHWAFGLSNVGGEDLRVQTFQVLVEILRRVR